MKTKIIEFLGGILLLLGFVIILMPIYWAFAENPWYLFLMFVSWLPGIIVLRIAMEFFD